MSAAVAEADRRRRRRPLLPLLLALSLALNLCFIAGAAWIQFAARPHGIAARIEAAAAQLQLNPQQRAAFERYLDTLRTHIRAMHEQTRPLIGDAWAELAKPDASAAAVMQRFDEAAQKRRGFQQQLTADTLAFLATLSPPQRAEFVNLARHHFWSDHNRRR